MTQAIPECHRAHMLSSLNQRSLIACSLVLFAGCRLQTEGKIDDSETLQVGGTSAVDTSLGGAFVDFTTSSAIGAAGGASTTVAGVFGGTGSGESAGGMVSGGTSGTATGGTVTGDTTTGGTATGGTTTATGGAATGGTATGGTTTDGNAGESAGGTSSGSGGTAAVGCNSIVTGADPCSSIPAFVGEQQLDGSDSEFCTIPSFELSFSNADSVVEYVSAPGGAVYPEIATVRVAWSASYLHAFIRVLDNDVVPAMNLANIWNADGIDLMITTDRMVTGSTADDPTAMHLIVAPGLDASPGLGATVKTSGTTGEQTPLAAEYFATTTDSEGYVVELRVPWPNGATVAVSQGIYFDFTLNSAESTDGIRDALAILYLGSRGASPCGATLYPYCDDRIWCTSAFE